MSRIRAAPPEPAARRRQRTHGPSVARAHVAVPHALPLELAPYRAVLGAIGRIESPFGRAIMGNSQGTAFHIGDGYVLTAGHAVLDTTAAVAGMSIAWAVVDGHAPALRSKVIAVIAQQGLGNVSDFALLRVSPAPDVSFALDSTAPLAGRTVALVGHPGGRPLAASAPAPVLRTVASKESVTFFHGAKNEGGNSGGPVIDTQTLAAIGIHIGTSGQAMALTHGPLQKALRRMGTHHAAPARSASAREP